MTSLYNKFMRHSSAYPIRMEGFGVLLWQQGGRKSAKSERSIPSQLPHSMSPFVLLRAFPRLEGKLAIKVWPVRHHHQQLLASQLSPLRLKPSLPLHVRGDKKPR